MDCVNGDSRRKVANGGRRFDVEDWLWISLPMTNLFIVYVWKAYEFQDLLEFLVPSAWVCLLQCLMHKARIPESSSSSSSSSSRGNLMAMALIPSLVHTIAMVEIRSGSLEGSRRWLLYAQWTCITAGPWVWFGESSAPQSVLFDALYILLVTMVLAVCTATVATTPLLVTWETLEWALLHSFASRQHTFFVKSLPSEKDRSRSIQFQMATWGEYQTLVFLLIIGALEWQTSVFHRVGRDADNYSENDSAEPCSTMVAQSGVLGCLLSIGLVAIFFQGRSLIFKLFLQITGPLFVVELSLRHLSNYTPRWTFLPFCLQWLFDFFLGTESNVPTLPRYWGILYWGISLLILALPTFWIVQRQQSVVITRKWFHFVAILLFAPTTRLFPMLMSLGYAVSLCVLLVLEAIRHSTPCLDDFYRLVHDPTKDKSEGIIISHICLILGCAMPLWIAQVVDLHLDPLFPQWGVLCLGVGDAMGAVVGKTFGRTYWGENHRTVEGSLAMWVSMIVVGTSMTDRWQPLLVATTFVTLLEAYTIQMDNLALPLAGSLWIILLSSGE